MDILSVVTRVPILFFGVERNDDDFADRINYKYTVAVLIIFAIIVTNRQFGTKQIHCWIPAYFTRNYEEYINDICWVSNTYYISLDQKLPEAEQIRKSFELKYYQWVPFILLSQAFFFYIPHLAWRALSRRSGIDIRDIVEAASNYKSVDKYENRQKYMSYMLTAVDQYVDDPRRRKETRRSLLIKRLLSGICCISGKFLGNYLMVLYLFIKLAFISNCISQLFVLNLLLGHEFHMFGFELLDKILNGKGWDTGSRIFPKISMCDFRIREVGNPKVSHRYTVQCVLPINLFNQQIFTFIWFWYGIVLIVNIYSLCVWTYRFLPAKRLRYISRRIEIMRQALFWRNKQSLNFEQMPDLEMHAFEKDLIRHFVHDYLESDGLFILRVLSSNTSDFVCTELIQELWKYYRKQRKFNRTSDEEDEDDELNDDDDDDETRSLDYKKNMDEEKMEKAAIRHRARPTNHKPNHEEFKKANQERQQHLMINNTDSEEDKSNLDDESHAEGTTHDEDDNTDNENHHHRHHNHDDPDDNEDNDLRHQYLKKPTAVKTQSVDPRVNLAKKVVSKMPLSEQISNVYHKPKKPDISSLPAAAAQASSKVFQLEKQLHQQEEAKDEDTSHHQEANNTKPKRPVTLNQSSVVISNYPNTQHLTSKLVNASSSTPSPNLVENKPAKQSASSSSSSSSSANISPTTQSANAKNKKFLETET